MKKSIFFLLLLCFLFLCSCDQAPKKYSAQSFSYFDTVTTIVGYAENRESFDAVCAEIFAELEKYHRLFTIYESYDGVENLHTLNEKRTIQADDAIVEMLLYGKEMYALTDGAVNIAMGSVLSLWHDYREKGDALPPKELLTEAAFHMDISDLLIDAETGKVSLLDPEMRLDVGAIAKGFAAEMTARSLEEKGIFGYLVNLGGNVRTLGKRADGMPWNVGIEDPLSENLLATLLLSGESLVTSGSYQRYYTVEGKRYHHIIDPETLMPSEGYLSVSVVCNHSAKADALSTALFCMDFETGLLLVESLSDVEAIWLFPDGTTKTSKGFQKFLA